MKKTLSVLFIAILVFSLSACSFGKAENTPEDVVKEYLEALKIADMDKMNASYYKIEEVGEKPTEDDLKVLAALFSTLEYKIISSDDGRKESSVKVSCKKADYGKANEAMTAMAVKNIENGTADGSEGNDYYVGLLIDCLEAGNVETISKEFDIKCIKIDNKWYLDAVNESLDDFIYSDISGVK